MQLILIHNEKAGSGKYSRSTIRKFLEEAGHRVCPFSPRRDKPKNSLKQPADLIVIAGGDGAVAKVVNRAKAKGPALTILPLGTANNIATSLGITGEPAALIETWDPPKTRPFYRLYAKGPWGRRRIIEGIGFGCFEQRWTKWGRESPILRGPANGSPMRSSEHRLNSLPFDLIPRRLLRNFRCLK